MRRVVDEFEVYNGAEHSGIHTGAFAIVVIAQHIAMFVSFFHREAGPKGGLVESCADLAYTAADALDGTSTENNESLFIAISFADAAQIFVEGKLFTGGDDNAEEVGGGAGNVVLAGIG